MGPWLSLVAGWLRRAAMLALLGWGVLTAGCGGGAVDEPSSAVLQAPVERPLSGAFVPSVPTGLSVTYGIKRFSFSWSASVGATHYQLSEDPDGAGPLPFQPLGGDLPATGYVQELPALHLRLNAKYVVRACNAVGCSADSAPISPSLVPAIGYFKASNPGVQRYFGRAVALSADGLTLAVGAEQDASGATGINGDEADTSAPGAGAVYVFRRAAGGWAQEAYVKASNTDAGDGFGHAIALSGDGNTLVVGAPGEDGGISGIEVGQGDNSAPQAGAVYVFSRTGGVWSQQAYIKAHKVDPLDVFGTTVALSDDGNVLAVGAPLEDGGDAGVNGNPSDNSLLDAGAVYLFHRNMGTWTQGAYIKASKTAFDDRFGSALAISGDGMTLAVGTYRQSSFPGGVGSDQDNNLSLWSGAAYVFARTSAGGWAQQAFIKPTKGGSLDYFAYSVALSWDGSTLAVGAPLEDGNGTGLGGDPADNSAPNAGAVYIFGRVGSTWAQHAYIKASNTDALDKFGYAVALSADGDMLVVGAPVERSPSAGINGVQLFNLFDGAGAAYVFKRAGGAWSQQAYVKSAKPGVQDYFGEAIALSSDGNTLAVGAHMEDGGSAGIGGDVNDNSVLNAGAVYLY